MAKPYKKQGSNKDIMVSTNDWNKPVKFTPPIADELMERKKVLDGVFNLAHEALSQEIKYQTR